MILQPIHLEHGLEARATSDLTAAERRQPICSREDRTRIGFRGRPQRPLIAFIAAPGRVRDGLLQIGIRLSPAAKGGL